MATFWDGQEAQSGIIQSYDWGQEAQVDWFEAVAKLEGDNCHAATVVTGMDGTRMWLKDAFPSNGRRIGVAAALSMACGTRSVAAWLTSPTRRHHVRSQQIS